MIKPQEIERARQRMDGRETPQIEFSVGMLRSIPVSLTLLSISLRSRYNHPMA